MVRSLVIHETLHAPYFIFVRCGRSLKDADLLRRFGLSKYVRGRFAPQTGLYSVLANDGAWTMLADNWHYMLWRRESKRKAIELLATDFDVFTCSVGDSNQSFDFDYYRDGMLVRRYVVTDPDYSGGSVTQDIGARLTDEADILANNNDQLAKVLSLAKSIGIKTDYAEDELRVYVAPEVVRRPPEIVA